MKLLDHVGTLPAAVFGDSSQLPEPPDAQCSSPRRFVFVFGTAFASVCVLVPYVKTIFAAALILAMVNFGIGIWISMYLAMAQEVSRTHISTAAGTLSGFGSLVGALAMWAVGRVTQYTGSFAIPMAGISLAVVVSAMVGWAASRPTTESTPEGGLYNGIPSVCVNSQGPQISTSRPTHRA